MTSEAGSPDTAVGNEQSWNGAGVFGLQEAYVFP
jgi:hypothetical protein